MASRRTFAIAAAPLVAAMLLGTSLTTAGDARDALPGPPPGAGTLDPWLDARGDALFGDLAVGAHALVFDDGPLESRGGELQFAGDALCTAANDSCRGPPGPEGPQGERGPPGPPGPSGIAAMAFKDGPLTPVGSSTDFLSPRLVVSVGEGQSVLIRGDVAMGSWQNGGGMELDLWPCFRLEGSANLTLVGDGIRKLYVSQYQRHTFGASGVAAPAAGTYEVGICGRSSIPGSWVTNDGVSDRGYVTALVANVG